MTRYMKVGYETTYGTPATSLIGVRVRSVEPSIDQSPIYDETIEDYLPADAIAGPLSLSIRSEFAVRHDQITQILAALFGGTPPTPTGTDPYTWAFTSFGAPKSLTVEIGDPQNTAWQFTGVGISSMEFTFEAREVVTASVDMIAKTYTEVTPTTPTYSTEQPFAFHEASLLVDGLPVAGCRSVTVSIDRSLADDAYVLDDRTLYALHGGIVNVSGRIRLWEDELTEFRKAIGTTGLGNVQLQVKATRGNYSLTIDMPIAIYNTGSFSISGRDVVDREIEYRALSCSITLVNGVSAL